MAASGILSPPLQLVIGEDMVTGQPERYSVAAKSNSKSDADDQSTINTANSTGSLSSSDETQSSLLSSSSQGSHGAMGLDLTDEGALEGDMAGAGQQGSVYDKAGLMSAAAAAAEAARAVRQHHKLQQQDAMGSMLSTGEMNDPYAMSTPVTTPGATSSCASNSPPAPGNLPRSQSFNGMEGEHQDPMDQFAGYRYQLEQLHMRGEHPHIFLMTAAGPWGAVEAGWAGRATERESVVSCVVCRRPIGGGGDGGNGHARRRPTSRRELDTISQEQLRLGGAHSAAERAGLLRHAW